MKVRIILLLWIVLTFFSACQRDEVYPMVGNQNSLIPNHIPLPNYNPTDAYLNVWSGLGRSLFYDTNLSSDSSLSCASCHAQVHGFADHGLSVSQGFGGAFGDRNAPAIFNMAWNTSFMWDGGINHIEMVPVAPFTSHIEMNLSMSEVVSRVNQNDARYGQFRDQLSSGGDYSDFHVLKALAAFMSTITSFESKYDEMRQGKTFFSAEEEEGYRLFQFFCNDCHTEPLFTNHAFASNRIPQLELDEGRFRITLDSEDYGKFKVPTLRNLSYTYPYRHDGKERSLDIVLQNYLKAGEEYLSDDIRMEKLYNMTSSEMEKVKAFLMTLNDHHLLSNSNISEP